MTPLHPPLSWLADTSLRASVVLVLLIAARPWLRRLIGSRAVAALWLVIAVRLLLPWPIESRWGLGGRRSRPPETLAQAPTVRVTVGPGGGKITPRQPPPPVAARATAPELWTTLWALGAIIAAARLAYGWRQTRRWAAGKADPRLTQIYHSLPTRLRGGVALRLTDDLETPTLAGVLHPRIWLPRAAAQRLSPEQLRHVLLHELGHARRRDLLAQWMMELACCVHWFNPLAWIAARLARADRELACDAWVLAQTATNADRYGETLIHVVQSLRGPAVPAAAVTMAAGHRNLRLRVREIGDFQPVSWRRGAAALALAAAVVAVGTASRAEPAPAAQPSASPTPPITPVPPNEAELTGRKQLSVECKILAVSEAAVQTLSKEKTRFHDDAPMIDRWADFFRHGEAAPNIQQVMGAGGNYQALLDRLQKLNGVYTITAPRVTFKPGQKAIVQMTRELSYPTEFTDDHLPGMEPIRTPKKFERRHLGFSMNVEGNLIANSDSIAFQIDWKVTELQEYLGAKDQKPVTVDPAAPGDASPVIVTHLISTKMDLMPGTTVILVGMRSKPVLWSVFDFNGAKDHERALLLSFITLKLVDPEPAPSYTEEEVSVFTVQLAQLPAVSSPAPEETPEQPPRTDLPYGVPVKNKPGFVVSPYAPDAGYVDLRGYKRGQEVRDPYTNKMFLVP